MSESTEPILLSFPYVPADDVWMSVVGEYPAMARRICDFADPLTRVGIGHFEQPSPYELPANWAVVHGIGYCQNYLLRAYKHRRDFLAITEEMRERELAAPKIGTYAENLARYGQQKRQAIVAHGEIEEFYICIKLLLDRLATMFTFYFAIPPENTKNKQMGSSHNHLVARMTQKRKVLPPILDDMKHALLPQMQVLSKRIFTFRNVQIEHVKTPDAGMVPAVLWENPTDRTRPAALLLPNPTGQVETTDDPTDLINLVEPYIGQALDFMEANRNVSILTTKRVGP
jgi:hypothetical protein